MIKQLVKRESAHLICDGCLKPIRTQHIMIHQKLNKVDVPMYVYLTCDKKECKEDIRR
jgi:hypothetical protein